MLMCGRCLAKPNQTIAKTSYNHLVGIPAALYIHRHRDCGTDDYISLINPTSLCFL